MEARFALDTVAQLVSGLSAVQLLNTLNMDFVTLADGKNLQPRKTHTGKQLACTI